MFFLRTGKLQDFKESLRVMLNNASHSTRLFDKVEMVHNELFGKVLQLVGLVQVGSNEAIGSIVN